MLAKEDRLVVVELEPGVWLADGEGDPPRTLVKASAKRYQSSSSAVGALCRVRKSSGRAFEDALIVYVVEPNEKYVQASLRANDSNRRSYNLDQT